MRRGPSYNALAQGLHVALGALGVTLPVAAGMENGQMWGTLATLLFAAIKEAFWDPRYEDPETRGSGLEDFTYYTLGILLASVMLAL